MGKYSGLSGWLQIPIFLKTLNSFTAIRAKKVAFGLKGLMVEVCNLRFSLTLHSIVI